jgi:RNA polymerase sigma factor (sigma-70 family)
MDMATAPLGTLLRHIHKAGTSRSLQQWTDRQLLDEFAAGHSESAFATLVSRHGPLVWRVCRRVLNHEQDAEDAFQATFLVLARNCGSIRQRDTVGSWLHGVAYRTAMKAKRSAARRRHHESRLQPVAPPPSPNWDEVQTVLDEEVQRLPSRFREAFVLCVLEGHGSPEAAAGLGCKEGTVKSRVNRARRLLEERLARRGIQLAALLGALSVAQGSSRAALPAALADATLRFGLHVAAGESAAGVIPSHVAALTAGVTRAMFLTRQKISVFVLLVAGLLAAGAGLLMHQAPAAEQPKPATAKPLEKVDANAIAYGGRVLGPDGKPVPGAKLYLSMAGTQWQPENQRPITGAEGRFRFTVPKATFGDSFTIVGAQAPNYAPGWVQVPIGARRDNLTIRLVADDMPITGQIVDLEGKTVAGATLRVLQLSAAPDEDLGPWLEAVHAEKGAAPRRKKEEPSLKHWTLPHSPKATTDAQGRFRLTGVGRNRIARIQLDGPTIASAYLHVVTRPGKAIAVTRYEGWPATVYHPASFQHPAGPTRPIIGVVRDRDTKKPLTGVTIESNKLANDPVPGRNIVQTTTDSQGRYRLVGMPVGQGNKIRVVPTNDQPYLSVHAEVLHRPGLESVTVDFELKRGIWIEGKLTNKATGKPVQGHVDYLALLDNPNLKDHPGFNGTIPPWRGIATKEDGSYRMVGLPGPGLVVVYYQGDRYVLAPKRDDEYRIKEPTLYTAPVQLGLPINYCAIARINPKAGVAKVVQDLTVIPAGRR